MSHRKMDFFLFFGSLYSYLAVMRIGAMATNAGVEVRWRPFNLRTIMIEQNNIPRNNPVKMQYAWRDVERRAIRHGLEFKRGVPYPVDPQGLGNRVGVVAALDGWCEDYAVATYRAWFAEHKMPGEVSHVGEILRSIGKDPGAIIARAESAEIRSQFDVTTDEARKLGIFGAPTFVIGAELFWGDDRLEDALDWAISNG